MRPLSAPRTSTAAAWLRRADYERRIREGRSDAGRSTLLTLKGAPVDARSGSRTELETAVADAAAMRALLVGLGYEPWAAFTEQCTSHRFNPRRSGDARHAGHDLHRGRDTPRVETILPPLTRANAPHDPIRPARAQDPTRGRDPRDLHPCRAGEGDGGFVKSSEELAVEISH